jgi:hypothetical protein
MGCTSYKANPDLWFKTETRPDDKFRYYAHISCYVDDILCVHHDPMIVLDKMLLTPSLVGNPAIYTGATLRKTYLANDSNKYVAQPVKTIAKNI